MSDAILIAVLTAAVNGAVTWGVVRSQLRLMRHAINAAHKRLDLIDAPAAGGDAVPEL